MNYPAAKLTGYRRQPILQQFQLAMVNFFVLFALILYICLNYFCIAVLANRVHIIPTCPKLASPQFLFNLWMLFENPFRCYTLYCLYYPFWRVTRHALHQKMNVVFICSYFYKNYLIPFRYPCTGHFQGKCNLLCKNLPSILGWTNIMIQQQPCIVTLFDMVIIHTTKLTNPLIATPEAEHRGIRQIKRKTY